VSKSFSSSRIRSAERQLRVRSRPLDEIDESKLALALWMMAKRLVDERAQSAEHTAPKAKKRGVA
jgi:hypothetical protein